MTDPKDQTVQLPEEFSWHAHPASERKSAATAASFVVLAIASAVWISSQSLLLVGLGVAMLLAALNRFFLRSRFSIDQNGITARFPLRIQRLKWRDTRRFLVDERGGYLSSRSKRSWLDAYRGLHVLFGSHRTQVIARIRAHLPEHGG